MINIAISIVLYAIFTCADHGIAPEDRLRAYRMELDQFRSEFGNSGEMPDVRFMLFGMGNRTKLIYKQDTLAELYTSRVIKTWQTARSVIVPPEYAVYLTLDDGRKVSIFENETGVWIKEGGKEQRLTGTENSLKLPAFNEYKYPDILKVLHHEILINITDHEPMPNCLVYSNPWRRDGAMMAMCLKHTGNISLIRDWVLSLDDPYDRNNAGETEADNLGQTLYLLSFFADSSHPIVGRILQEVKKYEVTVPGGKYIRGRSDFHETPVYQTKWLKYGLRAMNLPDHYTIPDVADDYSALFWWDFKEYYAQGTKDADDRENYPYLGWACDHFHKRKLSSISNRDYPLTWEINASQADYPHMKKIDRVYAEARIAQPHTWHASEVFLYLIEIYK